MCVGESLFKHLIHIYDIAQVVQGEANVSRFHIIMWRPADSLFLGPELRRRVSNAALVVAVSLRQESAINYFSPSYRTCNRARCLERCWLGGWKQHKKTITNKKEF